MVLIAQCLIQAISGSSIQLNVVFCERFRTSLTLSGPRIFLGNKQHQIVALVGEMGRLVAYEKVVGILFEDAHESRRV